MPSSSSTTRMRGLGVMEFGARVLCLPPQAVLQFPGQTQQIQSSAKGRMEASGRHPKKGVARARRQRYRIEYVPWCRRQKCRWPLGWRSIIGVRGAGSETEHGKMAGWAAEN